MVELERLAAELEACPYWPGVYCSGDCLYILPPDICAETLAREAAAKAFHVKQKKLLKAQHFGLTR
jgi:hypothetical protein